MALKYKSTADIKVQKQIIDQVIGQAAGVNIMKKAAKQRRHVLLIGEPGTGKCVGKNTLIATTSGPIRAESLFNSLASIEYTKEDETYAIPSRNISAFVLDRQGKVTKRRIVRLYKGKRKKALKITTASGAEAVLSGDHPLLTLKDNKLAFVSSEELTEGSWIGLARQLPEIKNNQNIKLPEYYQYKGKNNRTSLRIKVPEKLTPELAYFLGIYVAEGRWQGNIKIYNQNKKVQQKIKDVLIKVFEYPKEYIELNENEVYVKRSRSLIHILNKLYNIPIETTKQSYKKSIPLQMFRSEDTNIVWFLSGYIDGDGHISNTRGLEVISASNLLIEQLRLLLLRLNIQSRVKQKIKYAANTLKKEKNSYTSLTISDSVNLKRLARYLNLIVQYKKNNLNIYTNKKSNTNVDIIPDVGELIYDLKSESKLTYKDLQLQHQTLHKIRYGKRQPSRTLVQKFVNAYSNQSLQCTYPEFEQLEILANADILWDTIAKISLMEEDMYDFEIEELHNYIINGGIIVHNSMLGLGLAEMLPKEKLVDTVSFPNPNDENAPLIRTVPAGQGRDLVAKAKVQTLGSFKNQSLIMFILVLIAMFAPWWARNYYNSDIMFAAFFIGGMMFLGAFVIFLNLGRRMPDAKVQAPKVIVDSYKKKQAPFNDATGAHAGALLGDVLHDPFQSGGLGTPAHERVVAGMIHKSNLGVLFIDEIATLQPHTQQELLSAIQEKKFSITGQSERSAGAMVRTEPVPCDFILIAAGNLETVKNMHPALRSRIRGYGYEVYMNDTMPDNQENRDKIAIFVAQEIKKDKKIPHFNKEAVDEIIKEAKKMANRKGHLTLRLRELGGLIRAAGDLASEQQAKLVSKKHIQESKKTARTLEKQLADKYIEKKKEYEVIVTKGKRVGRVNGLAVMGGESAYSGIILPIESEVTPGGKESEIIATGKLGEIAKEAVKNVSAIIKKYFGEDLKETYDIHVQFLQTYEGVEGDSASIAIATTVISAFKNIPIKQEYAMTGSLSVRGEVLPIGGVTSKIEAAIAAGIKKVIVPKSNMQDIIIDPDKLKKIKIIPVETIQEVLKEVLDWNGKKDILKQISKR